jgi:putative membrane protein
MVMRRPTDIELKALDEAVKAAEGGTSGEIVTIVAERSDSYHDAGLHYAVLAMFVALAVFAFWPEFILNLLGLFSGGWVHEPSLMRILTSLWVILAVLFLIVRYGLTYMPLRLWLTPKATRRRRVRRRALDLFKVGTEARTTGRTGILIYLSLGEHMAEIVADKAIHSVVPDTEWGDAMAALIREVREGRIADGMIAAVGQIGTILSSHLPRAHDDVDELPDRLIEL